MLITAQDLVKKSVNLYKNNFTLFFKLAILVSLPSLIAASAISLLTSIYGRPGQATFVLILYGLLFVALSLISYFVGIWFIIVKIKIVADRNEDKDTGSITQHIHNDKKFILPVFLASLLAFAIAYGAPLILIILGIFFVTSLWPIIIGILSMLIMGILLGIWFFFTIYAIALDGKDVISSLKFSKKLTSGRWWAVVWRILVPAAFFVVGTYLMQMPFEILLKTFSNSIISGIVTVLYYLINTLFAPFLIASQVILYTNLKNTMAVQNSIVTPDVAPDEPPF